MDPTGVHESLEAVRAADPIGVSAAVLEIVAVLSPAVVRCDLLRAAGQAGTLLGRGRRVGAAMVDQAVERLTERSLLGTDRDGQVVTVDGLVARVVRDGLAQRGRLATACGAAAAALETTVKLQDRLAVRQLLGQVTALLENAGTQPDDAGETVARTLLRLWLLAVDHLAGPGDTDSDSAALVIAAGEPLLANLERVLGPADLEPQNARNALTTAYHAAGRVAEAIPLLRQSLAAQVELLGPDSPGALALRNNLASAYRATGRPAEAIPLFEDNAAACERLLGAEHPKTVASRHKLALTRQEAEPAPS